MYSPICDTLSNFLFELATVWLKLLSCKQPIGNTAREISRDMQILRQCRACTRVQI